jgi:Bacterial lectin
MNPIKCLFSTCIAFCITTIFNFSQCSGGSNGGALSPAPNSGYQTATVTAGTYYTFVVPAFGVCGAPKYFFSLCPTQGGSAGFDTQITILDNSGSFAGGYNDDNCGLQSYLEWTAPAPGTYRILFNSYPCGSSGATATMAYRVGNFLNGPYCLIDDATPISVGGFTNCAQFTAEVNDQRGCIWNTGTISFASAFDYTIKVYLGNNVSGADGATFSFQNAATGRSTCGGAGGGLGMEGVPNALAVEFDTYDNGAPADIPQDHIAINNDGALFTGTPLAGPVCAYPTCTGNIDNGVFHDLRVTWNPGTTTMDVYFDGNMRLSCVNNFVTSTFGGNPNVYWGFTGATGALNNQQYFCPISIPLPVDLIDITANCNDNKVNIDWVTASEINNSHFEIERSYNAIDYELAGRVNGGGNSNEVLHYQFTDTMNQLGTVYYRLKQVDFNGDYKIYNPLVSQCDNFQSSGLEINYGLTTNYGMLIDFTTEMAGTHIIRVFDMKGIQLVAFDAGYSKGSHQQSLLIPQLVNGIYLLTIENAEHIKSKKIAFQR